MNLISTETQPAPKDRPFIGVTPDHYCPTIIYWNGFRESWYYTSVGTYEGDDGTIHTWLDTQLTKKVTFWGPLPAMPKAAQ